MKIYSITINQTSPVQQAIYVPPHSTFFLAPKVIGPTGAEQQFSFIDADGEEMLPYPDPIASRTVYAYVSGEPSVKNLKLVVPPQNEDEDEDDDEAVEVQTYTIKLVTTTSTVFDVDLAGESGGAKPQDAGPGIVVTDRGTISIDTNVIPTYEGSNLHLGTDTEIDLDSFATKEWVSDNAATQEWVSDNFATTDRVDYIENQENFIQEQLNASNDTTGERAKDQWPTSIMMEGEYEDGEQFFFEVCTK